MLTYKVPAKTATDQQQQNSQKVENKLTGKLTGYDVLDDTMWPYTTHLDQI